DPAGLGRSAGIVEQTVDPAEFFYRERDQRAHLLFLGDIGLAEDAIDAEFLCQRLAFGPAAPGDDNLRALLDKNFRRPETDAAGRAGDHRDLSVEPTHGAFLI